MSDDPTFRDLIRRVRAGDEQAATELVQRYGRKIKAMARPLLTHPELRHLSSDVCQSVLKNFFKGARAGQFEDLNEPAQLMKLFSTMVHNNVITYWRKLNHGGPRPPRVPMNGEIVDPHPSPGQVAAGKEEWERILQRLPPKRRQVVELRAAGHKWADIGAQVGESPEALRVWHERWLKRIQEGLPPEE